MEPEEFLDPTKTVYHYDQIITENDLRAAIEILFTELAEVPMTNIYERQSILLVIKAFDTLLEWIVQGKPDDFHMGV